MERKLAAILAADIAGYSRLMGVDEEATLDALRSHRAVVDGLVAVHRGRIFNSAGDSVVAEFASAVEASLCAVEIQQEIARRNEAVPKDRRLEFRIGVNIGDVMVEGGNLFGDGVNVADRVRKLADPGGVCVSRNVHDQLRNRVGFALEPMGEHQVKNIAAPVSVYRVVVDGAARRPRAVQRLAMAARQRRRTAAVAAAVFVVAIGALAAWHWLPRTPARTGFPSLAVLPFQNLSGDPALDPYGDGVAEDLITVMSRFPDLTVVSRSSSFGYKGKDVDPVQVGRDLKVDYVIEGSVQKKGDGLRINAQLIDAQTNAHVWAEGYDGSSPPVLQEEATGKIVVALTSLGGQIMQNEYQRTKGKKAEFGEHDYYLSGHEVFSRSESIEEHDRAGATWREGLETFPDSALLRIALAWHHFTRPWNFDTDRPFADYRRAGELAREALAGQNLSPFVRWRGHMLMAYIHWFEGDFVKAVAAAEAAAALAPYDADTLSFLSRVQIASGNTSRGLEWVKESMRRDPTIHRNTRILAWIYYLTGDYEKSIEAARRHEELSRRFTDDASWYMAASYVRLGRLEEARAAARRALEVEPWTQLHARNQNLWRPYKDPAIFERELADYAEAGLPELPFGYDAKAKHRLAAEEIKALTLGRTRRGHDVESGAAFTDVIAMDGSFSTSGDFGSDTATVVYLGGNLICYSWADWGPSCGAVFRNPAGSAERQDEYVWIEACCEYRFSMVK